MANSFVLTAELRVRAGNLSAVSQAIRNTIGRTVVPLTLGINNIRNLRRQIIRNIGVIRVPTALLPPTQANMNNIINRIQTAVRRGIRPNLNVNVNVNGNNRGGGGGNTANNLNNITRNARQATSAIEELGSQTGQSLKRFGGFTLATTGIFIFTNALKEAVGEAITFQDTMVKIGQVTQNSLAQLGPLSDEITRLATTFGVSSKSLVEASLTLAQAGFSARDTRKSLEILAKTDLAPTFKNIGNTTEAMIAIMGQFGLSVDEMGEKFGGINKLAADFAVESSDITTAVQRAGATFVAAGGNVEEFGALITSVRATTRQSAETIATGFNTIFARLQRLRTVDFLEKFGIKTLDDKGRFKGPLEVIQQISDAVRDIPQNDPRFAEIVEEIGGFRQLSKVVPLLRQTNVARLALNSAIKGANSLEKDAEKSQESFVRKLTKVREEFNALIRDLGNSSSIKSLIDFFLQLTKSVVKLGSTLEKIAPSMALLLASPALRAGRTFTGAVRREFGGIAGRGGAQGATGGAANGAGFGIGGGGGIALGGAALLGLEAFQNQTNILGSSFNNLTSVILQMVTLGTLYNAVIRAGIGTERLRAAADQRFNTTITGIRDESATLRAAGVFGPERQRLQQARRDAVTQLRTNREPIDRIDRLQSIFLPLGVILASVGSELKQSSRIKAKPTDSDFSQQVKSGRKFAAAGGGIEGAGIRGLQGFAGATLVGRLAGGAALGARAGVWGAAIGALVGALFGATSALKEFENEVFRVKLEETSDKFSKTLDRVLQDKLSPQSGAFTLNSIVRTLNSNLSNTSGENRNAVKAEIDRNIGKVELFVDKLAGSSNSMEEFERAAAESLPFLARFTDLPLDELKNNFRLQIQTQEDFNKSLKRVSDEQDKFNQRLIDTNNIVSAFSDAVASIHDFDGAINDIIDILNNNAGAFQQTDLKEVFERALSGRSLQNGILQRSISNVSNNFQNALGPERSAFLASSANEAADVLQKLPEILLRVRSQDPTGEQGRFAFRFEDEINKVTKNKEIRGALMGEITELVGEAQREPELLQKLRQDPAGIVGKFSASLDPFFNVFKEAIPELQAQFSNFSSLLADRRKLEQDWINLANKGVDTQRSFVDSLDTALDRSPVLNQLQGFENQKLRNTLRNTDTAPDVFSISTKLSQTQDRLADVDESLRLSAGDAGKSLPLEQERDRLVHTISSLGKALEFLATESKKVANIESELAREKSTRETKFGFAKDFVFNDRENQRNIGKTVLFGTIAAATNNLNFVPQDQRAGVGSLFDTFSESRLSTFGVDQAESARQGRQVFRRGKDVQRDIIGNELGLNDEQKKGITLPGDREAKLINELEKAFQEMEAANNVLVNNLDTGINRLNKAIETQNQKFLNDLKQTLVQADILRLESKKNRLSEKLTSDQKIRDIAKSGLSGILGKDITDSDITDLKGNINDLQKLGKIRQNQAGIIDVQRNNSRDSVFGAGPFGRGQLIDRDDARQSVVNFANSPEFRNTGLRSEQLVDKFEEATAEIQPREIFGSGKFGGIFRKVFDDLLNKQIKDLDTERNNINGRIGNTFKVGASVVLDNADKISDLLKTIGDTKNVGELGSTINETKEGIKELEESIKSLRDVAKPNAGELRLARGGRVPGSGSSDTVPALLTPGEFVLNKDAVKRLGLKTAFNLNAQKFAKGGAVGLKRIPLESRFKLQRNPLKNDPDVIEMETTSDRVAAQLLNESNTVGSSGRIAGLEKLNQDSFIKSQIDEERKNYIKENGLKTNSKGIIIADVNATKNIKSAQDKERQKRIKEIAYILESEGGIEAARGSLGLNPVRRLGGRGPSPVKIAREIGLAQRAENAAATQRIKNGTQERFEKNFFVGPNIPGLERLDRTPVQMFNFKARQEHDRQRELMFGTQLPTPDPTINLGQSVSLGSVGFTNSVSERKNSSTFNDLVKKLRSNPFVQKKRGQNVFKEAESEADLVGFVQDKSDPSLFRFPDLKSKLGQSPAAVKEKITKTNKTPRQMSVKDILSNEARAKRLARQADPAGFREKQRLLEKNGVVSNGLQAGIVPGAVQPPIQQAVKPPQQNVQNVAKTVNNSSGSVNQTQPNIGAPVFDLARYEKLVNSFTNSTEDLLKKLSTLTLKFEHQVNHTGQLNVVGAMEASKAISDAIIKRTVFIIEDSIKKIKHDANGNHVLQL